MATILPFVVRPRLATPVSSRTERGMIIFFPGVRYEKTLSAPERDDDRPAAADGARRKGKRKAR